MTCRRTASLAFLGAAALAATLGSATAEGSRFIIVNPAGRGDQGLASSFLGDFSAALAASWPTDAGPAPAFEGSYHVTSEDALASIRGQRPVLALVTAGFFRDQANRLALLPLARPVLAGASRPVVHLVQVSAGALPPAGRGFLSGRRLGGQLAGEPRFLLEVALAPLVDPAAPLPDLVPVARTLEVVRRLRAGTLDLGVLDDADWNRLVVTGRASGLAVAFTSEVLPTGPVVAVQAPRAEPEAADAAARLLVARSAARALLAFESTPQGRAVLATMGLARFAPEAPTDAAGLRGPRSETRP